MGRRTRLADPMATQQLTREEELHWLALKLIPGLGTRKAGQLIERFRTPQAVFRSSISELEAAGASLGVARNISSGCSFEDAVLQQERMAASAVLAIPISDPRYPPMLREIFDPPILLFARGRVELLNRVMIGVVGTRRPSTYGMAVADRLSGDLSAAGLVIASGMARGIDTSAHRASLRAGGDTVAVFGCGVDILYPSENRKLSNDIAEKGLLLSEFPMGAPAFPQNFPVRNRIISGMSVGVLVVEGAQYSGSSITARLALDQGRDVFAVPGNITSKMSWGPNLLIKQGAKLVQDWNDVVVELAPDVRLRLMQETQGRLGEEGDSGATGEPVQASLPLGPMAEIGRRVLAELKVDSPVPIDNLLETLENCSSSELIATLFELEMLGMIRQLPGKNFVKIWQDGVFGSSHSR